MVKPLSLFSGALLAQFELFMKSREQLPSLPARKNPQAKTHPRYEASWGYDRVELAI